MRDDEDAVFRTRSCGQRLHQLRLAHAGHRGRQRDTTRRPSTCPRSSTRLWPPSHPVPAQPACGSPEAVRARLPAQCARGPPPLAADRDLGRLRRADRPARRPARQRHHQRGTSDGDTGRTRHSCRRGNADRPGNRRRCSRLPEAPAWRFRVSSRGADLRVDPVELLTDWLAGTSLPALAEAHLAAHPTPRGGSSRWWTR